MTPAQADEIIRLIPSFLWLAEMIDKFGRHDPAKVRCGCVPDYEGEGTLILRRRRKR